MTGRVCIFCGSSGVTNEDVIPRWTHKVLRQLPQYLDQGFTRDTTKTKSEESGNWIRSIIRQWPSKNVPERSVRVACGPCNSGWMSQLETRCKSVLTPMILGRGKDLIPADQEAVSLWATKTAMVAQFLHPDRRCIPDEHYHDLFRSRQPRPDASIYLAHQYPDSARLVRYDAGGFARPHGPGYVVTLALGELIIQVFTHVRFAHLGYRLQPSDDTYLRRIWPKADATVTWPPVRRIDDIGGYDALSMAFG